MLNSAEIARSFRLSEMYRDPCGIDGITCRTRRSPKAWGRLSITNETSAIRSDDHAHRRRLLMAARALRDQGIMPPGSDDASVYGGARSGYFVSSDTSGWQQVYASQLANGVHPPRLHAAE